MSVKIKKNESRLGLADLVVVENTEFWSRPVIPNLDPSSDDVYHTVKDYDRIDTIAKKYFKNEGLWWVIAHANDLRLLPMDLKVGQRIRIPDPRRIRDLFS